MKKFISYSLLLLVKYLSAFFYRFDIKFLNQKQNYQNIDWDEIRLIVFLNHTSLYEPIFIRLVPNKFLWRLSNDLVAPGADITLERPIVGRFFKGFLPGITSITRKKDFSWSTFLSKIKPKSIVAILPEGRMKRANGLDKHGEEMTVRGGIADILEGLNSGKALFVYSGGLHHIQIPGQKLPKLFKRVKANIEVMSIRKYKSMFQTTDLKEFKYQIINDLNYRLNNLVPKDKN